MVTNTGTYLDSPFHFDPDGKDLAELPLDMLADLPEVLVNAKDVIEVGIEYFQGLGVRPC